MADLKPLGEGVHGATRYGNAYLLTYERGPKGALKINRTHLVLESFSTDLDMESSIGHLRRGVSVRPIRLTSRTLSFTTIWPAYRFRDGSIKPALRYRELARSIKKHWALNLERSVPIPRELHYHGAKKTWKGFIDNIPRGAAKEDIMQTRSMTMRLTGGGNIRGSRVVRSAPYLPTSQDINEWGKNWYRTKDLLDDHGRKKDKDDDKSKGKKGKNSETGQGSGNDPRQR